MLSEAGDARGMEDVRHMKAETASASDCNIPTCVTEVLVGRNEPTRYSISRECLLTLRSYWLVPAHRVFRFTGREVRSMVNYLCSSIEMTPIIDSRPLPASRLA